MYKFMLDAHGAPAKFIKRIGDGANIPMDPGCDAYQQYLQWAADGNAADPPDALSAERVREAIVAACQQRLTDFAATRNYSSLEAISKYKDITDAEINSLPAADRPLVTKFRAECRYLALVTAQTWAVLYRGLAEVQAGTRPMPGGYADISAELPPLFWPV